MVANFTFTITAIFVECLGFLRGQLKLMSLIYYTGPGKRDHRSHVIIYIYQPSAQAGYDTKSILLSGV